MLLRTSKTNRFPIDRAKKEGSRGKKRGGRDLRHNKTNILREQHQGQVLRCRKVMDRSLLFRKETQEDS